MDWLSRLMDFMVTALHILAALFLAYGAYLAIFGAFLSRPSRGQGSSARHDRRSLDRRKERRVTVRRMADRLVTWSEGLSASWLPHAASPAGLQPRRRHH